MYEFIEEKMGFSKVVSEKLNWKEYFSRKSFSCVSDWYEIQWSSYTYQAICEYDTIEIDQGRTQTASGLQSAASVRC